MKVFSKLMLVAMMMAASITTQAQELYVGSYNIRYQNDDDAKAGNAWQQRMPVLCGQILFEHPDIFGAQEVLESQAMMVSMPANTQTSSTTVTKSNCWIMATSGCRKPLRSLVWVGMPLVCVSARGVILNSRVPA